MSDVRLAWAGFWIGLAGIAVLIVATLIDPANAVYLVAWGWAFILWFGFVTWAWR